MVSFKFVISDPQSRKSHQIEVDQGRAIGLVGKKIGDEFNGDVIGLTGYSLQITGGTDRDGSAGARPGKEEGAPFRDSRLPSL